MSSSPFGHFVRHGLQSILDLAGELQTSLNTENLWSSHGKPAAEIPLHEVSAVIGDQNDTELSKILVSEESRQRADVLLKASLSTHPLSSGTIDDDEAATIRQLPRPTIEALLLAACSAFRANQPASSTSDVFGPVLGPAFTALVEARRARVATRELPSLFSPNQRVIRNGVVDVIPSSSVHPGDLLLLHDGACAPCDCILVALRPTGTTATINCERVGVGSRLPIERRSGPFRECKYFGSLSAIPQQSFILLSNETAANEAPVALAVALRCIEDSSWKQSFDSIVSTNFGSRKIPPVLKAVEALPLCPAPFPAVHLFHRHALHRAAVCDTVILPCETIVADESNYVVSEVIWGAQRYSATSVQSLWNFSDVLQNAGRSVAFSSVSESIPERCKVQSILTPDEGQLSSRIGMVSSSTGLRSLVVAAMLATCYSPAQTATMHTAENISRQAVRKFLEADAHVTQVLRPQYVPMSNPVPISMKGASVKAQLFKYQLSNALHSDVNQRVVLVVFGNSEAVLQLCFLASTPRGICRLDDSIRSLHDATRDRDMCSPAMLFSVATADIHWDLIGSKCQPGPVELAALVAGSTDLCFQGTLASLVSLRESAISATKLFTEKLNKRVCIVSFARDNSRLEKMVSRLCSTAEATVITPDALGRWTNNPPPPCGSVFCFCAVGHAPEYILPQLYAWVSNGSGTLACGSTIACLPFLQLADVGTMISEDVPDALSASVLRTCAQIDVHGHHLDDLSSAILFVKTEAAHTSFL